MLKYYSEVDQYWEGFYESSLAKKLQVPSQFAVFALGEAADATVFFDIGCGSGRDSLFLTAYGKKVVGVDASKHAVALCENLAKSRKLDVSFIASDIHDPSLPERLELLRAGRKACVYARFFLHAIDEEKEDDFLNLARRVASGGYVAVEFRTDKDSDGSKVTAQHYRRYIDPVAFKQRAESKGFVTLHSVVGKGFAKYKQDDAHVARFIFGCD